MEYSYKAIQRGETIEGFIEAESEEKALSYLRSNDMTVLNVHQKAQSLNTLFASFFGKVKFNDVVDFTRQLSIMLTSGLTLIDSLEILKRQSDNPAFLKLMVELDADVKAGTSLSDALAKHPRQFSNLYLALVKAGEASGKLDEVLAKLSENLEKQRTFRNKIKGAMVYPVIVVVAMVGVMFVMITFVVPQLLGVYKEFDIDLPLPTKILITLSDFFALFWPLIIIGAIAGFGSLMKVFKTKSGKKSLDHFMLRLPILSRVVKVAALVDTTRTLSILIASGVSILEAFDIITETTSNVVYQEAFVAVKHAIERGETLGNSLDATKIFPPILVQMTAVGESTGHLDETLGHLANYFDSEAEMAVKALTTMIEPLILVVLGLSVGFVVIAVITPIFSLSSQF